jgi:hypothetical protein
MTKYTLILIFTLLFGSTVCAQTFTGGIHGGIVASQIDGDKMSGYRKFSPYGGLFLHHRLGSGFWSAQMELNYAGRGACSNDGSIRTSIGYAEIPLLAACNIFHFPLQIRAGAAVAYKIFENTTTFDITRKSDDYGTWDIPVLVSIDYSITERIAIDARFSYSALGMGKGFYNNALNVGLRYYIVK